MEQVLFFQQGPLIADIVAHVFSLLSITERQNVAKVCRYWQKIVYLPCFWREATVVLPLNPTNAFIQSLKERKITRITLLRSTEEDVARIFAGIPNLTHLNMKGCPQVSEYFLQRELKSLLWLEHLALRRCRQVTNNLLEVYSTTASTHLKTLALEDCVNITHVGLKTLIKKLKGLETLELTWCEKLNNCCLRTLSDSCPNLSCLKLRSCDWVSFNGMQHVAQKLKHLKKLDLKCCHNIEDDSIRIVAENLDLELLNINGVPNLERETVAFVARKMKSLKHLSFGGEELYFVSDCEDLDEMFTEIAGLKDLQSFNFDVFDEKYDREIETCIISLLKNLTNLKVLDLGSIKSIGEETASAIANCMPRLEKLALSSSKIEDNSIAILCSKLKKLNMLDVRSCSLSDEGVQAITSSNLKSLILSSHPDLTSVGVQSLTINLGSLTSLDLMDCKGVTDKEVALIACGMPHLLQLNFSNCHQISNQGAIIIGKHLKELQQLALEGTHVSDKGFVFVCQKLSKLLTLAAGNCFITDKGLIDSAKSLENLEELEFGCLAITDEGLKQAVQYLKGLTDMTLILSHSVTLAGIETIMTGIPNLTHLGIEECRQISVNSVRHLQDIGKATITVFCS